MSDKIHGRIIGLDASTMHNGEVVVVAAILPCINHTRHGKPITHRYTVGPQAKGACALALIRATIHAFWIEGNESEGTIVQLSDPDPQQVLS